MDQKTIPFELIKGVTKSTFTYVCDEEDIKIPLHRVIFVRDIQKKELIWRKIAK